MLVPDLQAATVAGVVDVPYDAPPSGRDSSTSSDRGSSTLKSYQETVVRQCVAEAGGDVGRFKSCIDRNM